MANNSSPWLRGRTLWRSRFKISVQRRETRTRVKFEGDGLLKRYAVDEHARLNSCPGGVLTNLPSDHKSDILACNEALASKVRCFKRLASSAVLARSEKQLSLPKMPYVLKSLHLQSNDVSPFRANAVATSLASPGQIASSGFGSPGGETIGGRHCSSSSPKPSSPGTARVSDSIGAGDTPPPCRPHRGGRQALTFPSPNRLMDKGKEPP